jgi:TetR/AcrR family transcriptional regulator
MSEKPNDREKQTVILHAAKKRFDHYGVGKTTMNEIAADIGMSKASLYYYYPDKESLFLAVIQMEMDEFLKSLSESVSRTENASKKLKSYVTTRHGYFKKLVSIAKMDEHLLTSMQSSYDSYKQSLVAKEKELIQLIFQQGIKDGEFESFNTKLYADVFVTAMQGVRLAIIHKKKLNDTKEEDYQVAEQYQKQLTSIFLKSITKS